ncbi:hypothetical protein Zmor_002786 [Zophobas morio]|uniref:Uncharacterized protein n=1 Tax=Zophobas morio TaxID=2755281 RepID=A0AA38M0M1_9CUCU|nr:hypothetical protein Zmor_002786 [Zophobas morio]
MTSVSGNVTERSEPAATRQPVDVNARQRLTTGSGVGGREWRRCELRRGRNAPPLACAHRANGLCPQKTINSHFFLMTRPAHRPTSPPRRRGAGTGPRRRGRPGSGARRRPRRPGRRAFSTTWMPVSSKLSAGRAPAPTAGGASRRSNE